MHNNIYLYILVLVLVIVLIYRIRDHHHNLDIDHFTDYFDCYLKLTDINPQFVEAYKKYDNKHVSNGKCTNARLHVTVEPCPTNTNGIPSPKCKETASLISSKGNPLTFPLDITPNNISNFFGIQNK